MNSELKSMLDLVFDGLNLAQSLVAKKNFFTLLPQVFSILTGDVPGVIAGYGDLLNEIKALPGTAQEADLVQYIEMKFGMVAGNDKAPKILAAVLKLVQDVAQDSFALQSVIRS